MKVGMKVNVRHCIVTHAADDILPLSRQNPTGNRRGAKRCCVRPVRGGGATSYHVYPMCVSKSDGHGCWLQGSEMSEFVFTQNSMFFAK